MCYKVFFLMDEEYILKYVWILLNIHFKELSFEKKPNIIQVFSRIQGVYDTELKNVRKWKLTFWQQLINVLDIKTQRQYFHAQNDCNENRDFCKQNYSTNL